MIALILASGFGARLRPLTDGYLPKQFVPFSFGSMLELTVDRVGTSPNVESIVVVSRDGFEDYLIHQTRRPKVKVPVRLILETITDLNESGGSARAALKCLVSELDHKTQVLLCASDHVFRPRSLFHRVVAQMSQRHKAEGGLVALGSTPRHPSNAFGYLVPSKPPRFVQKPPIHHARQLILAGALWNCMVYVSSLGELWNRLEPFSGCFNLELALFKGPFTIHHEPSLYWTDLGDHSRLREVLKDCALGRHPECD